jgi:hypothetical protein
MTTSPKWKSFKTRELREAVKWAAEGGIAVHLCWTVTREQFPKAPKIFVGKKFAHLFGPNEESLIAAAESVGCKSRWIQRKSKLHFDLTGRTLRNAIGKCDEETEDRLCLWAET